MLVKRFWSMVADKIKKKIRSDRENHKNQGWVGLSLTDSGYCVWSKCPFEPISRKIPAFWLPLPETKSPSAKSKAATYTNKTAPQNSAGSCSARSTRPTPHPRLWQARQRPWAGVSDFLTIRDIGCPSAGSETTVCSLLHRKDHAMSTLTTGLAGLKLTAAQKSTQISPAQQRRNKLLAGVET